MNVKLFGEEEEYGVLYTVYTPCMNSIHFKQVCGFIIKLFKGFGKWITQFCVHVLMNIGFVDIIIIIGEINQTSPRY